MNQDTLEELLQKIEDLEELCSLSDFVEAELILENITEIKEIVKDAIEEE